MMNIIVLDSAEQDIFLATNFYELQGANLGNYFLDSIFSDIESLYIYAGIHVVVKSHYRLLSKRFPFAIYYKVNDDTITIHAVLDCRRTPELLRQRL